MGCRRSGRKRVHRQQIVSVLHRFASSIRPDGRWGVGGRVWLLIFAAARGIPAIAVHLKSGERVERTTSDSRLKAKEARSFTRREPCRSPTAWPQSRRDFARFGNSRGSPLSRKPQKYVQEDGKERQNKRNESERSPCLYIYFPQSR